MTVNEFSGIDSLGATVANIVADTLAGDLGLRARHISAGGRSIGLPTLHFMTSAQARLAFTVVARGEKSFLFNLFGTRRSEKIADIRIKFEISPDRDTQPVSSRTPEFFLAFPEFVDTHNPAGTLGVTMLGGHHSQISRMGSGHLSVSASGGSPSIILPDQIGPDEVLALLGAIAGWVQAGRNAAPVPLRSAASASNDRVDTLLMRVATSYRKASRAVRMDRTGLRNDDPLSIKLNSLQDADRRLAEIHPILAGPYRFKKLDADILVNIDSEGRLARKTAATDAQQFDLRTWMDPRAPDRINVALRVSDLLTHGETLDAFAQFLLDHADATQQLASRVERANLRLPNGDLLPGDRDEMACLIEKARSSASLYFVRLQEREDEDAEAFHLAGSYAGHDVEFVFGALLQVDLFPNVRPRKLNKVTLVAARVDGGAWAIFKDDDYWAFLVAFLSRFFSILLNFQERIATPAP